MSQALFRHPQQDDAKRSEEEKRRLGASMQLLQSMTAASEVQRSKIGLSRAHATSSSSRAQQEHSWTRTEKNSNGPEILKPPDASGVSLASSNLRAALAYQEAQEGEVQHFLIVNGLFRYIDAFVEHGFDCMEVVELMEERHMRELGMKTGHILKLQKRLAERHAEEKCADETMKTQLQQTLKDQDHFLKEAVAAHAGADSTAAPLLSRARQESTLASPITASASGRSSLLDGEYDEEAAAADFREAVRAWREGHSRPLKPSSPAVALPRQAQQEAVQAKPSTDMGVKKCCYQCYKQFFVQHAGDGASESTERKFCSDACAARAEAAAAKRAEEMERRKQVQTAKLDAVLRAAEIDVDT
eukprot:TRINITY_DN43045_c0_g1_i1.p1 TRINITY_DN43045_c0_g1~~TRINITY_DN43045_c0_g1_i1.p1  ORF type:complete len:359 (-),score=103.27 TRINITY_DN43045_c0_g1_i1:67-1143(-)